ncbi:MAG: hypothetical protein A2511_10240 [Deltaproteobacteria bacterium RIFOXYD12_FULL_50_9]|nr:MAG: hypothetical protein A2511_10240 [Deltaproteobacteria bacterium RIFOXYD12_FULL_50_9]
MRGQSVEDETGLIEATFFPKSYARYSHLLTTGPVLSALWPGRRGLRGRDRGNGGIAANAAMLLAT